MGMGIQFLIVEGQLDVMCFACLEHAYRIDGDNIVFSVEHGMLGKRRKKEFVWRVVEDLGIWCEGVVNTIQPSNPFQFE